MYYLHYTLETNELNGFYNKNIHNNIPNPNIKITANLWTKLLEHDYIFKDVNIIHKLKKEIFDSEDIKYFDIAIREIEENIEIHLTERVETLETENADLLMDSAIKDSKIKLLENDIADMMLELALMKGGTK